jgi:predicted HNH restriction endonuclease
VVLCSNCHRMVHRKRFIVLSLDELRALVINGDTRTPSG